MPGGGAQASPLSFAAEGGSIYPEFFVTRPEFAVVGPGRPARHLGLVGVCKEGRDPALVRRAEVLIGDELQAAAQDDAGLARGKRKAGLAYRPGVGGRGESEGGDKGQRAPQPTTSAG